MFKRFENKIALITGGSRGIGAAIARRLAEEGCHIAISYSVSQHHALELVKTLESYGVQALAVQADQADPSQIQSMVKKVAQHFGRIDILVNNAVLYLGGAIDSENLQIDEIQRMMAINIGGVFSATYTAIPFIQSGGRIINIGSISGERTTFVGGADYAATKAALIGYTHGWARDLGTKNITVNLVQPGPIDTEMNPDHTEFAEMLKKNVALGRYGKANEVAAAVSFLASSEASYITGATLTVDGGFLA